MTRAPEALSLSPDSRLSLPFDAQRRATVSVRGRPRRCGTPARPGAGAARRRTQPALPHDGAAVDRGGRGRGGWAARDARGDHFARGGHGRGHGAGVRAATITAGGRAVGARRPLRRRRSDRRQQARRHRRPPDVQADGRHGAQRAALAPARRATGSRRASSPGSTRTPRAWWSWPSRPACTPRCSATLRPVWCARSTSRS